MGGMGSGAYGYMGPLTRKRTVEETDFMDIQKIKNALDHRTITFSWESGKEISILTKRDYIILAYKAGEEQIKTRVNIDTTSVGFGERLWFNCPSCEERTSRLYVVGKYFQCRDCQGLTYLSCQESGDLLDYMALKIRRLQKNLGLKNPGVYDRPYFKPKNMHQRTFDILRFRLQGLQRERDGHFLRESKRRFGM